MADVDLQPWWEYAKGWGLTDRAAILYVTLVAWSIAYGLPPLSILSGYRDPEHQAELRRRWDAGDRGGLMARPAERSAHMTGDAFDTNYDANLLGIWGYFTKFIENARWGGEFRAPDWNHFDVRG